MPQADTGTDARRTPGAPGSTPAPSAPAPSTPGTSASAPSTPETSASAPSTSGTPAGRRLPGPRVLFRTLATAEMITWALLLTAMALKYSGTTEALMPLAGGLHGFVFLCYALVAVAVWTDQRWSARRGIAAVGLAVVPFATVPFERALARRGAPGAAWRLAPTPERRAAEPKGAAERVLAWVLRNVLLAAVLAVAVVAAVFAALLAAGPPGEWLG